MVGHFSLLELSAAGLESGQPFSLKRQPLTSLGPAKQENAPQLLRADPLVKEPADVGQGYPEVAQYQDPMQALDLVRGVPPVAGVGVGPCGTEETQLVVVAKGCDQTPGQSGQPYRFRTRCPLDQLTQRQGQGPSGRIQPNSGSMCQTLKPGSC